MKRLFFTAGVIACLLSSPLPAPGQSGASLAGRVTDPEDRVVPEASVRIYDRNSGSAQSTRTDADGEYRFGDLSPGEYLIEADAADLALAASKTVRLAAGAPETLDLDLSISSLRTQVLVTASSTPQAAHEVSKATDVVGFDEIEQRDELSIAESLRNVPGLRVVQLGGPGSLTSIRMRGLRNTDTALLVDGLRFRDAADTQGSVTPFLQDLLVVDPERVEVLRGSGSSLYGSHAIGGVINVSSSQGGGSPHGEILAEGGGLGLLRGLARAGGGLADNRLLYSGGITHLNVRHGVDGFDPYRNTSGQGFLRYNLTPSLWVSGRLFAGDGFAALNESPFVEESMVANHPSSGVVPARALPPDQVKRFQDGLPLDPGQATYLPAFNDPDSHRAGSFLIGAVSLNHELSPTSSYRISYQAVDTRRSFRDGPAGQGDFDPLFSDDARFDGRVDTLQARTDHRLGEFQLVTFGYEFEREEYDNVNTDENPDPAQRLNNGAAIRQRSHSLFAQDQLRLVDGNLQISLSGRVQSFNLSSVKFTGGLPPYAGQEFESPPAAYTGDAALAYFFRSSGTKLRAHVGNAYRAAAGYERFGSSFFGGSFSLWGDPRLSPERSIAFDTGVDQWLANSRVRLSATYFYTALQETIVFDFGVIDPVADPFGRFGGYRNTGGGIARGAEFSATVAPVSSLDFTASYTYVNSALRTATVPEENFFKALGVSDHMFTLVANQRIGRRVVVTFDLFAASDYPLRLFNSPRLFNFGGPVKADIVVSYTAPIGERTSLRLYGKAENFFDNSYHENGFRAPGTWGVAGLALQF